MSVLKACILSLAGILITLLNGFAQNGASGILGTWREPTGSVIHISRCGSSVCLKVIGLGKEAPETTDGMNPDASLKSRPLCGLEIGKGFQLKDAEQAEGGTLYDPKTGNTYKGSITSAGDKLDLRGYIGLKMFGKSETWTRASAASASCPGTS